MGRHAASFHYRRRSRASCVHVRSGCSREFLFILIKYKGMGSGWFNNKRTDFVWGDRQPAFITGGALGLHVYMSSVVTCVWLGSGPLYKKKPGFVWVDRQPAFTTGGAPGLHVYMSYVVTFVWLIRMRLRAILWGFPHRRPKIVPFLINGLKDMQFF